MMRICTVIASEEGFRTLAGNPARTSCGVSLLDWAKEEGASLLVLPAGYLRAEDESPAAITTTAAPLVDAARAHGIGILVGVDACPLGWGGKRNYDRLIEAGRLPLYGVAWSPGLRSVRVWRQRSTTSTNWRDVPGQERRAVRALRIGGRNVGVVLCGEAFSRDVRDAIVGDGLDVAILIAHGAVGLRHWQALKWFSFHGVSCVRAVHAAHQADNSVWTKRRKKPAVATTREESGRFWAKGATFDV
jgi:hypothetical protein